VTPETDNAIETEGAGHRYGRRWALVDLTFRLRKGSVAIVAGRNGAGKSTLLRVLGTALRLDLGTVTIAGRDLVRERDAVRHSVALLSHYSYTYERLTALENLRCWAGFLDFPADRGSLVSILARVNLDKRADDPVADFSAGMRKRLAIARILLQAEGPQDASIILLDEPYGQLDPHGFRLIENLVGDLRARGKSLLVATHQVERIAPFADEGIMLAGGRLVWSGPASELPSRSSEGLE
jgi:heme exporter protein A